MKKALFLLVAMILSYINLSAQTITSPHNDLEVKLINAELVKNDLYVELELTRHNGNAMVTISGGELLENPTKAYDDLGNQYTLHNSSIGATFKSGGYKTYKTEKLLIDNEPQTLKVRVKRIKKNAEVITRLAVGISCVDLAFINEKIMIDGINLNK